MRRFAVPVIISVIALAGIGTTLFGLLGRDGTGASKVRLDATNVALVEQGRSVYTNYCASCHGDTLAGQPNWQQRKPDGRLPAPPHDASGHTWHHDDAMLFKVTKQGPASIAGSDYKSDMPAFEGVLSDDEIIAVLSFIKSTWPPEVQERQSGLNPL